MSDLLAAKLIGWSEKICQISQVIVCFDTGTWNSEINAGFNRGFRSLLGSNENSFVSIVIVGDLAFWKEGIFKIFRDEAYFRVCEDGICCSF